MLHVRLFFLGLLGLAVGSCASYTATSRNVPFRRYSAVSAPAMLTLVEKALRSDGYAILERDYASGTITARSEPVKGAKHGLVRWQEKKLVHASVDSDRLYPDITTVRLEIETQEKAPLASEWTSREEDSDSPEYIKLLQALDRAVLSAGGRFD
jgi:hypothetical protein